MIAKYYRRFVSTVMLVILVSMFLTNIVLAGEDKRIHSDPELRTTNLDPLVSRTAFSSFWNNVNVNSTAESALNHSTRDKAKSLYKTMCYIDQASAALCSDLNIYDIYFPLNLPVKPQYTKMMLS